MMAQPEKIKKWQAQGFSIGAARQWIQRGYQIETAIRWQDAGVFYAGEAGKWEAIGVSPYSVTPMLRAGMTPHDAVLWNELGYSFTEAAERHRAGQRPQPKIWWKELLGFFSSADYALEEAEAATMHTLLQAGIPATRAKLFVDTGWTGADAIAWAKAGVDASQALVFRHLAITAKEAKVLQDNGRSALAIVSDWWDAGIPRDQVANWLGAGFSAAEAAQARAKGMDVEQAAVLRALGGGGD